jgi:hypothetical protein
MKRSKTLYALVALNAALLVGLVWKMGGENTVHAQRAARGDYVMVPAELTAATNGVIYIVDTRNGMLSAMMYDNNKKTFMTMAPINVTRILEAGAVR